MDKTQTTEANAETIVSQETTSAEVQNEAEAKIAALEAEKATILEREANYKAAYLKEKVRNEQPDPNETEDEKIRRITREELANTRISQIDTEKEALFQKTIKENKELKLAQLNKTGVSATVGAHTESAIVKDTLISPEQLAAFKKMGKDDKWIENYKKNFQKNAR